MKEYNESLHRSEVTKYRIECAKKMTGRVLDVGGGLGAYLPFFNASHVTVLDVDRETLDKLEHDDKVIADATQMPFEDDSYDNVWACAVCQYFDIVKFISEAKRVCVRGGKILILVPNAKSFWDIIKKMFGMRTWADQEGIFKHYTVDELVKYGKVTGEIRFLPFEALFRNFPRLGHTIMLEIINDKDLRKGLKRK